MGKLIKYGTIVLIVGFLLYNSVYFKKLSEVNAATPAAFEALSFSKRLWDDHLPLRVKNAITLDSLVAALKANPEQAFAAHTNAIAVGNIRYSLVQATGKVIAVTDDEAIVKVNNTTVHLAREYIYGNAIRDASKLVEVKDFVNTTDLNNISEALNKQVKDLVIPAFKPKPGDSLWFGGAVELNKEHLKLTDLPVIPVSIKTR